MCLFNMASRVPGGRSLLQTGQVMTFDCLTSWGLESTELFIGFGFLAAGSWQELSAGRPLLSCKGRLVPGLHGVFE